jgi:hypothetical protein
MTFLPFVTTKRENVRRWRGTTQNVTADIRRQSTKMKDVTLKKMKSLPAQHSTLLPISRQKPTGQTSFRNRQQQKDRGENSALHIFYV